MQARQSDDLLQTGFTTNNQPLKSISIQQQIQTVDNPADIAMHIHNTVIQEQIYPETVDISISHQKSIACHAIGL